MIKFLFIAVLVVMLMLLVRAVVHRFWPGWGTVLSNGLGGAGLFMPDVIQFFTSLLSDAQALPWANILDAAKAQAVIFGILAANMIMRKLGAKAKV
jgi:hypothetical protein